MALKSHRAVEACITEEEFAMSMRVVENFLEELALDLSKSIIKAQEANRPPGLVDFLMERRNNCIEAKKVLVKCRQSATDL
jgi:hypothetical protein